MAKNKKVLLPKPAYFVIACLFSLSLLGTALTGRAAAATNTLYFTQDGASTNTDLYVQVRENSTTTQVNAAEADFTYPTSLYTFVAIDHSASGFDVTASETGGSGNVSIQRGSTTGVTGDQLIGTVHFTVVAPGVASLTFPASCTQGSSSTCGVYSSAGNTNVITQALSNRFFGSAGPLIPIYRLYNTINHDRLLTTDNNEVNVLTSSVAGWRYENIAFYAIPSATTGATPVYRLYNTINHDRNLTTDSNEVNVLTSSVAGWRLEGIAFYASTTSYPGTIPIYRLYNTINHDRLRTADTNEVNVLTTSVAGWRNEGVAFYLAP